MPDLVLDTIKVLRLQLGLYIYFEDAMSVSFSNCLVLAWVFHR